MFGADGDRAARRRVFVRIGDEVRHDLDQPVLIAAHQREILWHVDDQLLLLIFDLALLRAQRFDHHVAEIHRHNLQAQVAGLLLGEVVEVAHQRFHAVDVVEDRLEEVGLLFIDRPDDALDQQVGVALHAGHGVSQFVRHQADEFALILVGAL